MPGPTRRRFLTIAAGLAATGLGPRRARAELTCWRGVALGAEAQIILDHPDAPAIIARARAEISRLEAVFSLFQGNSALSRLNATGHLDAPPFELLECLALAGRVHAATGGLFDPTVQPLWDLYARRVTAGGFPAPDEIATTLASVGWEGVRLDEAAVTLRPGMALTLNGVAQGFMADCVAALLAAEGLENLLVKTGEFRALGPMPGGGAWPVRLTTGAGLPLAGGGLASSSALGTTFDEAGRIGHILDPRTGQPAPARWRLVTITAGKAALADALSTAACLMSDRAAIETTLSAFPDACLASLS